jgi:hypothetical protein
MSGSPLLGLKNRSWEKPAARLAPQIAERVAPVKTEPAGAATPELRFATSLASRVVGYVASVP